MKLMFYLIGGPLNRLLFASLAASFLCSTTTSTTTRLTATTTVLVVVVLLVLTLGHSTSRTVLLQYNCHDTTTKVLLLGLLGLTA